MKKSLSVVLSVFMLLSCVMMLALGVSAQTASYPNGNTQSLYNSGLVEVGYHRIVDSFYLDQNCFKIRGLVRMYDANYFPDMDFTWRCDVTYATGSPDSPKDGGSFTYSPVHDYVNRVENTDPYRMVTDILVVHSVYNPYVSNSTLSAHCTNP